MAKGNQPVAKYRLGYVTATIWRNEEFFNVVLSKSYKDNGDWKETDQLGAGDLMNSIKVLGMAADFVLAQQ